jgi:hypothetical protein
VALGAGHGEEDRFVGGVARPFETDDAIDLRRDRVVDDRSELISLSI